MGTGLRTPLGPHCPCLSDEARTQAPPPAGPVLSSLVRPTELSRSPASAGSDPGRQQTALPRASTLVVRMCSIARGRLRQPALQAYHKARDPGRRQRPGPSRNSLSGPEPPPVARPQQRPPRRRSRPAPSPRNTSPNQAAAVGAWEGGEELRPRESGAGLCWSRCVSYSAPCLWRAQP